MGKRIRDDGFIEYREFYWTLALPTVVIPAILAIIRRLWEAHTAHHLQEITANYGFTSMLWDQRFGTYQPLAPARVERG